MKNLEMSQLSKNSKFISSLNKIILSVVIASTSMYAQENKARLGMSATSSVTGSGFGTIYSPGIFLTTGKSLFEAGLSVQKRKLNVSGARINYEYTVFDGATSPCSEYSNERLELYFFANATYHNSAYLSKAQLRLEKQVNKESSMKFNELKYNAAEMYGGFGLRIKVLNKLKWVNSMGVGGWKTFKGETNLERACTDMGLLFSTKIMYTF
ncbi:MAG: hypothetical protein Q8M29_03580 [Bacteroidota bacterium]|nr:hypothetical protein [Bacteroidota bacterium]